MGKKNIKSNALNNLLSTSLHKAANRENIITKVLSEVDKTVTDESKKNELESEVTPNNPIEPIVSTDNEKDNNTEDIQTASDNPIEPIVSTDNEKDKNDSENNILSHKNTAKKSVDLKSKLKSLGLSKGIVNVLGNSENSESESNLKAIRISDDTYKYVQMVSFITQIPMKDVLSSVFMDFVKKNEEEIKTNFRDKF